MISKPAIKCLLGHTQDSGRDQRSLATQDLPNGFHFKFQGVFPLATRLLDFVHLRISLL
jgi:hypothetical protein